MQEKECELLIYIHVSTRPFFLETKRIIPDKILLKVIFLAIEKLGTNYCPLTYLQMVKEQNITLGFQINIGTSEYSMLNIWLFFCTLI